MRPRPVKISKLPWRERERNEAHWKYGISYTAQTGLSFSLQTKWPFLSTMSDNNSHYNACLFAHDSNVDTTYQIDTGCLHSPKQLPHCLGIFLLSRRKRRSLRRRSPRRRWTSPKSTGLWKWLPQEPGPVIWEKKDRKDGIKRGLVK